MSTAKTGHVPHHYTGASLERTAAKVMAAAEDISRQLREDSA